MSKKSKSKQRRGSKPMAKATKAKSVVLSTAREKSKILPSVSALNQGQKNALRAIADAENAIVFLSGIAGTGKTYLAASWGLEQLVKGRFQRLIITRPYVEAGEKLGYLPGDFGMKIAPFMIPIQQTFEDHLSHDDIKDLMEDNKIVVLPLAYMRGVTFKNAFVLLDEAQNASYTQMHLFLTRIGEGSKMVVTGDPRQSDLGPRNGFNDALGRLNGVVGMEFVELDSNAVVRHPIIQGIDERYKQERKD